MADPEALKKEAALRAAALVQPGMRVGLGTGSTAKYVIEELGRLYRDGQLPGLTAVATSQASEDLGRAVGIPMEELGLEELDLAIDGADEIAPNLDLIKGLGGALTREKLVELRARRFVVIADERKLVSFLGEKAALPVEVVRFGAQTTVERLRDAGATGELRRQAGELYVTDNGNYIFDARFGRIEDPQALAQQLKMITGVVETGLFLGMAERAFVATPGGVRELAR